MAKKIKTSKLVAEVVAPSVEVETVQFDTIDGLGELAHREEEAIAEAEEETLLEIPTEEIVAEEVFEVGLVSEPEVVEEVPQEELVEEIVSLSVEEQREVLLLEMAEYGNEITDPISHVEALIEIPKPISTTKWSQVLRKLGELRQAKDDTTCLKYAFKALEPWAVAQTVDSVLNGFQGDQLEIEAKRLAIPLFQWGLYQINPNKGAVSGRGKLIAKLAEEVPEFAKLGRDRNTWREIAKAQYLLVYVEEWKGC
jgi:hypothetical protein